MMLTALSEVTEHHAMRWGGWQNRPGKMISFLPLRIECRIDVPYSAA